MAKDPRLERAGVAGFNKPKRTPNHPKKSHIVVAKEGNKVKTIRFGEQGAKTAGKPKAGESDRMKKKRASFKARHGKNIAKGKMSAAWWADKIKWTIGPIGIMLILITGDAYAEQTSENRDHMPSVQKDKACPQ
jgi:hypothetical protein